MQHAAVTFLLGLGLSTSSLLGDVAPATRPAVDNGWDARWFAYEPVRERVVELSTPTRAQVDWNARPPRLAADAPEPVATRRAVKPVTVDGIDIVHVRFRSRSGDIVPALLCTPAKKSGPFPVVIAVHGMGSNKAQVCGQVAPALTRRGFAVLAPDMPLHGERPGEPREIFDAGSPLRTFELYRRAVTDVRQCIDAAEALPQLDASRVVLAGYSMGSWIHAMVGAADARVAAMVLMVGGAHEVPREASALLPQLAAMQPDLAIAHFVGRPLLMLNAKHDSTVTPAMGRRLFSAAAEPKEQRWYDSGHLLPESAYDDAAEWIAAQ